MTRDDKSLTVLPPTNEAERCAALAKRARDRLPPFTQEALDAWISEVMSQWDLSALLER